MSRLGIIAATEAEAKLLTDSPAKAGIPLSLGEDCVLILAGMGSSNALQACQALHTQGCDYLLSWGTAGSLASGFNSGAIILPQQVWDEQGQALPVSDALSHALRQMLNKLDSAFIEHDIHQVSEEICGLQDKQRLHEQQGMDIVDMESASIVSYARQHKLQAAVLRCICDSSDMVLPRAILSSVNAYGQVHFSKLMWSLLKDPADIKHLILLAQAFRHSSQSLRRCAPELLNWARYLSTENRPFDA